MRKIFTLLFAAMLAGQAWAQTSFVVDSLKYTVTDETNREVSVGKISGDNLLTGDIVIPKFIENDGITYTITSIGRYAFGNCSGLTSVTIPNSVKSIKVGAFDGCSSLESITIPDSVKTIGDFAFQGCEGLKSITISNSVTEIGYWAFNNCPNLTTAEFASIESMCGIYYSSTFSNPLYFTRTLYINGEEVTNVIIPESVKKISWGAFYGCENVTSITIPNSDIYITEGAFMRCYNLAEIIVDEENKNYSSENGVLFNKDKTNLICYPASKTGAYTIPNTVISIGYSAFSYCNGLTSITIPESVLSIGKYAFENCENLKKIVSYATHETGIPTVGENAFKMYLKNSIPSIDKIYSISCTVIVPCAEAQNYKDSDWGKYSNLTFAEDFLYEFTAKPNHPEMGSVEILKMPDCSNKWATVKATPNEGYVFVMWDDKSTNEENSNVRVSGDRHCVAYFAPADADINIIPKDYNTSFWYYNGDTKTLHVDGHGELMIEADYMWGDLPKTEVEHVFIEDGFTYIDASTFQNFTALKDVRLPETLKKVGSTAFNGCESLESVVIPEGVREIEFAAFNGCSSMKYVVLPSTLQKMWSRAFGSCSMLDSIVVKCDTAIDLPSMVFYGGSINTKFYIPCGKKELYTSKECWTINVTSNDNFVETMVYDLSVASSDSKRGTAEIVEMPDCGTAAVVKATAKKNYQFLKWSDGSTANPYEFALKKDMALTAIFVCKQSEITVEADTNGTVSVPQYAYFEDSVEVKISPKLGYEIDKLTITANGEKLELKSNKFMMPATDVNIAATFKLADYKITVDIKNCKITVPETAHYGDTVVYELEVDYGYWVSQMSVKYSYSADKQYFIMPAEDLTITAEILRISHSVFFESDEWRVNLGDTVTLDIEPISGSRIELYFRDLWGTDVEVEMVGETSFIMPDSDVEVMYSYVKNTAVTESAADNLLVYPHGNTIIVENATEEIHVYDVMGRLVVETPHCDVSTEIHVNTAGLYIVKVGGVAKRVIVD